MLRKLKIEAPLDSKMLFANINTWCAVNKDLFVIVMENFMLWFDLPPPDVQIGMTDSVKEEHCKFFPIKNN